MALRLSDLRAVVRLGTEATGGVTHIVEGVHGAVLKTVGLGGSEQSGRLRGLTGMIYQNVRTITRWVGLSADLVLAGLESRFTEPEAGSVTARDTVLAALNGVIGDRLLMDQSSLSVPMTLRYRGRTLSGTGMSGKELESLRERPAGHEATGKLLVLIHGLCLSDFRTHAERKGAGLDLGEVLASTLGYTPVYVRYNTGRHTSENGRELSGLLESLCESWPVPIDELTIVAHSMGGLVTRSAVHDAERDGMHWRAQLKNLVFLGTPHHGAPLEKIGHVVHRILDLTAHSAPFARLARLRSAGITDLRYGNVLTEDWSGYERFGRGADRRQSVPLPEGVGCYAVAAAMAKKRGLLADRLIGDHWVPVRSALGQHREKDRCLDFHKGAQLVVFGASHMNLLSSSQVNAKLIEWLG